MTPADVPPTASLTLSTHQRDERARFSNDALRLIAVCLAIVTLIAIGFTVYAAREFLIPIAIAFLLAVMMSPITRALEARGLWPTAAAGVVILTLALLVAGFIWLVTPELVALSEQLPRRSTRSSSGWRACARR